MFGITDYNSVNSYELPSINPSTPMYGGTSMGYSFPSLNPRQGLYSTTGTVDNSGFSLGSNNTNTQSPFGWNMGTLNFGLQGLQSLGNLWGGFQSMKLAKDQYNLARDTANTNMNNSIQSYNTALEGRARARAIAENNTNVDSYVGEYMDRNRLTR